MLIAHVFISISCINIHFIVFVKGTGLVNEVVQESFFLLAEYLIVLCLFLCVCAFDNYCDWTLFVEECTNRPCVCAFDNYCDWTLFVEKCTNTPCVCAFDNYCDWTLFVEECTNRPHHRLCDEVCLCLQH